MDLDDYLKERTRFINGALERLLPPTDRHPRTLYEAMGYSLFAGGKRLRPLLVLASAESVGGYEWPEVPDAVVRAACAFECVHTYSLIHDDLPAMDDDDLRRGQPTCHVKFGEAAAILAGDALMTVAFELISASRDVEAEKVVRASGELARGAGHGGMAGGLLADLDAEGTEVDFATVEYIHTRKTGALILASIRCGAILSGASDGELKALTRYGEAVGLAFQVADDILDVEGSTEELGKSAGADEKRSKATYPALVGVVESRRIAENLVENGLMAIKGFDDKAEPLRAIARYIVERKK